MLITICKKNEEKQEKEIEKLKGDLISLGLNIREYNNLDLNLLNLEVSGNTVVIDKEKLIQNPIIQNVIFDQPSYYLASREYQAEDSIIKINNSISIGGKGIVIMAGPCAVESEEQIKIISESVKKSDAVILRGGAYKLRTSPYSFQGLGNTGIKLLKKYGNINNMPIISEITRIDQIEEFVRDVDIIQVGARNMQNYELLKELGHINKPILLKRGISSTIEEWLMSAEYILKNGNKNVILCERGIRTFEKMTRYTLDLSSVAIVKKISHLPIIVDPSHASGHCDLVKSMAQASIACGADGLIIEVHNDPKNAISDSMQALDLAHFDELMKSLKLIAKAIDREII